MTPPNWMRETIAEFGRSAGIDNFAFNERGTAALGFSSGAMLVFEYAYSSLNVMMTVPVVLDRSLHPSVAESSGSSPVFLRRRAGFSSR